jgi:hypothetical protein
MTDQTGRGPLPDSAQEEFERNAVDPVPWVGQDADGPMPVSGQGIPGQTDDSTPSDRPDPPHSDPEVPPLGARRKPER